MLARMEPERRTFTVETINLEAVDSVVLRRLIEEVRAEATVLTGYNRQYNRHMPNDGGGKYNRTYNRHNRS